MSTSVSTSACRGVEGARTRVYSYWYRSRSDATTSTCARTTVELRTPYEHLRTVVASPYGYRTVPSRPQMTGKLYW
eukprot:scaffold88934_cov25-Prasinocladus_malaysianus.AAC.1